MSTDQPSLNTTQTEPAPTLWRRLQQWSQEMTQKEAQADQNRIEHKENFNLLNCLSRHHLETFHSNVIHYLLNPHASHDCGALFIQTFLEVLKEDKQFEQEQWLEDFAQTTSDMCEAHKEFSIGEDGRIDIILESSGFLLVIENKIFARDQQDQLGRYSRYCLRRNEVNGKRSLILYLTLDGRNSQDADGVLYYPISYLVHIRNWLKKSIGTAAKYPQVVAGLKSYLGLLENKILYTTSTALVMEIRDALLMPENHVIIQHLRKLHDALVPVRNQLRVNFFVRVREHLEAEGFRFAPYAYQDNAEVPISMSEIYNTQYRGLRLLNAEYVVDLGDSRKMYFLIEHDWHELYYGLVAYEQNRPMYQYREDEKMADVFVRIEKRVGAKLQSRDNCWFAWKLVERYKDCQFADDAKNYEFASEMETVSAELANEVIQYLRALRSVLSEGVSANGS